MTVIVYLILTEESTSKAHNQVVSELDSLGADVTLFMHPEGGPATTYMEEGMPPPHQFKCSIRSSAYAGVQHKRRSVLCCIQALYIMVCGNCPR